MKRATPTVSYSILSVDPASRMSSRVFAMKKYLFELEFKHRFRYKSFSGL